MLTDLPSIIGNLRMLSTLRLSNNRLEALPTFMHKLTNLKEMFMQVSGYFLCGVREFLCVCVLVERDV